MGNVRKFKRGEVLFKEGDLLDHVYIIKSGRVALQLNRSGKKLEIDSLTASQVLGDQAVFGSYKPNFTAEATGDTEVMMIPTQLFQAQMESAPAAMKLVFKSTSDGLKAARNQIRSHKMEEDSSPCPQKFIPRLFSIITLVTSHVGEKDEETGFYTVSWTSFKIYATRMFLESHVRLQSLLELLTKMGYAELHFEKNEDDIDELVRVTIKNLEVIEGFGEFYQYNLSKGGRSEILYVDPLALSLARALVMVSEEAEPDRRGFASLPFDKARQEMKQKARVDFQPNHTGILENKGLFVNKRSQDDGPVLLQFDKAEFERVVSFWEIIMEIDQWNELGFVDMKVRTQAEVTDSNSCPECSTEIEEGQKFCMECGHKLMAA